MENWQGRWLRRLTEITKHATECEMARRDDLQKKRQLPYDRFMNMMKTVRKISKLKHPEEITIREAMSIGYEYPSTRATAIEADKEWGIAKTMIYRHVNPRISADAYNAVLENTPVDNLPSFLEAVRSRTSMDVPPMFNPRATIEELDDGDNKLDSVYGDTEISCLRGYHKINAQRLRGLKRKAIDETESKRLEDIQSTIQIMRTNVQRLMDIEKFSADFNYQEMAKQHFRTRCTAMLKRLEHGKALASKTDDYFVLPALTAVMKDLLKDSLNEFANNLANTLVTTEAKQHKEKAPFTQCFNHTINTVKIMAKQAAVDIEEHQKAYDAPNIVSVQYLDQIAKLNLSKAFDFFDPLLKTLRFDVKNLLVKQRNVASRELIGMLEEPDITVEGVTEADAEILDRYRREIYQARNTIVSKICQHTLLTHLYTACTQAKADVIETHYKGVSANHLQSALATFDEDIHSDWKKALITYMTKWLIDASIETIVANPAKFCDKNLDLSAFGANLTTLTDAVLVQEQVHIQKHPATIQYRDRLIGHLTFLMTVVRSASDTVSKQANVPPEEFFDQWPLHWKTKYTDPISIVLHASFVNAVRDCENRASASQSVDGGTMLRLQALSSKLGLVPHPRPMLFYLEEDSLKTIFKMEATLNSKQIGK